MNNLCVNGISEKENGISEKENETRDEILLLGSITHQRQTGDY